jgi:hypothetical protein
MELRVRLRGEDDTYVVVTENAEVLLQSLVAPPHNLGGESEWLQVRWPDARAAFVRRAEIVEFRLSGAADSPGAADDTPQIY